jgi:hypothetical protein
MSYAKLAGKLIKPAFKTGIRLLKRPKSSKLLLKNKGFGTRLVDSVEDIAIRKKYLPGKSPLDVPVRQLNRTPSGALRVQDEAVKAFSATPKGQGIRKLGEAYRASNKGSLAGFTKQHGHVFDEAGNRFIIKPAGAKGIKISSHARKVQDNLKRATNELSQTAGKPDWAAFQTLKGSEGHHARMVEGYSWAFQGAKPSEARELSQHVLNKGISMGRTQFNKQNIPQPVHKALHNWMDAQLGFNGLDMPSMAGKTLKQRKQALEIYLEHVQPGVDETLFTLMQKYNAGAKTKAALLKDLPYFNK